MLESIIENYVNPRGLYNSVHFAAWGLALKLAKPGLHNLRYWLRPPIVEAISIIPQNKDLMPEETFTTDMFAERGFLHERPLNHFVKLKASKATPSVFLNVGYLWHHFMISEALGWAEVKRLLYEEPAADLAGGGATEISPQGAGDEE